MAAVAVASMHSAFPGPRSGRNNFFTPAMLERPAQASQLSGSCTFPALQAQGFASPMVAFGPASGRRPPQVTFLRTTRRAAPPPPLPIPDIMNGHVADPFDDSYAAKPEPAAADSRSAPITISIPPSPSCAPPLAPESPSDAVVVRFPRRPSLDVLARHRAAPSPPSRVARCTAYDRARGQRAVAGILLSRAAGAGQKPLRRAPPVGEGKRAYSPSGLRTMVCVGDL
ncbi:hypothetical protein CONPUDRAFT_80192 [Coniophora puteana RWD-64-598 SS2]|uniref:Uncharacterized protein n=1 Tax=Coniophora puteana (strain RWD-64-598) TaxID=741705 RepID=A0A5M3N2Z2_CONPW|nr:uncharacterized protein CONPUDRAFT_80192 [Coniophora puteana RWD-64-598 SS2]EIW85738.1 hypothetical protein CONPUDRAFT_80192 [Coniophora puteana RWD-64-598 SS2]